MQYMYYYTWLILAIVITFISGIHLQVQEGGLNRDIPSFRHVFPHSWTEITRSIKTKRQYYACMPGFLLGSWRKDIGIFSGSNTLMPRPMLLFYAV